MIINGSNLIGIVAYQAYYLAPKHKPRKIEVIMDKVYEYIKENFDEPIQWDNTFRTKEVEDKDVYGFIKNMLFSIQEFKELNLTQNEYDRGGTESGCLAKFISRYTVIKEENWKDDFIDIDAFVQNVCYMLKRGE